MIKLTSQQNKALQTVQQNKLSLLIGYTGTGKTTITRGVILNKHNEGHNE